ncbi:MAG TPA: hypothetical protein VK781_04560, partial [Solirubrobacteraceae bacterium]|nr:hypothetical protein [Solirubrobacteraceae bacterium]
PALAEFTVGVATAVAGPGVDVTTGTPSTTSVAPRSVAARTAPFGRRPGERGYRYRSVGGK